MTTHGEELRSSEHCSLAVLCCALRRPSAGFRAFSCEKPWPIHTTGTVPHFNDLFRHMHSANALCWLMQSVRDLICSTCYEQTPLHGRALGKSGVEQSPTSWVLTLRYWALPFFVSVFIIRYTALPKTRPTGFHHYMFHPNFDFMSFSFGSIS